MIGAASGRRGVLSLINRIFKRADRKEIHVVWGDLKSQASMIRGCATGALCTILQELMNAECLTSLERRGRDVAFEN